MPSGPATDRGRERQLPESTEATAPGSAEAWTRYWRRGPLHSCAGAFQGNYTGPIAGFWHDCFGRLARQATVVDIGTGNGAIPRLALDWARDRDVEWQIHGIDLAGIEPQLPVGQEARSSIRFHPHTGAEAMPFADASVDLVCSQYGFEYTNQQRSLGEICRVLSAGGHLACILHAADSTITGIACEEAEIDGWLLMRSGYFEQARHAIEHLAKLSPVDRRLRRYPPATTAVLQAFDRLARQVRQRAEASRRATVLIVALDHFGEALRRFEVGGVGAALSHLSDIEAELLAHHRRLREQIDAALDRADVERLVEDLDRSGLREIRVERLCDHEVDLGWTLLASRRTSS